MRLRFLGTRGEIERRSAEHRRHSALLVGRVLVDCGLDLLDDLDRLRPRAIVLTHAHRDHAGGLRHGAPCPVWATEEVWAGIRRYRDGVPIGHASIRTQLDWCAEHGVARAVFTHCGSQIVRSPAAAAKAVTALAGERGMNAALAHDGLELRV